MEKRSFLQHIAFEIAHRFWILAGANLRPFFHQKSTNIALKVDSKRHCGFDSFSNSFSIDFGSILGPKLGPCWPLFRHKTPSRLIKKASKISPNVQTSPKCVQDPSRSPPDLDFGAPGPPFCSPRPRFWCPRSLMFKRFGVVSLLHYYIVTYAFQTSILGNF